MSIEGSRVQGHNKIAKKILSHWLGRNYFFHFLFNSINSTNFNFLALFAMFKRKACEKSG